MIIELNVEVVEPKWTVFTLQEVIGKKKLFSGAIKKESK
jgi:hypothetical protein